MKKGFVALVGAGPGNKGLMTIRGKELLKSAEVVVYDRLVSSDILAMSPSSAEMINVGKESSHHLVKQEDINRILLDKALEGKMVVRLKGGDPFVFGRGGEELELLCENNVAFEVVPGITSAISALSYAGIPATHRDFCSSLHIITGHAREGGQLSIPFESIAGLKGTIVFLMGVSSMSFLMEGLLKAGMNPDTKAAVIENGTRFNQRKVIGTISTIAETAREKKIHSPSIIAVGEVCGLSDSFDWFMKRLLFGENVIVTRPKHSAGVMSDRLRSLGAHVIEAPCIETVPLDASIPDIEGFDIMTFSSRNAVDIFFKRLFESGRDVRALSKIKIGAVGSQTADELLKYGIVADYVPEIYDGEHLGRLIAEKAPCGTRVLVLNALKSGGGLEKSLSDGKIDYERAALYETVYCKGDISTVEEAVKDGRKAWVMFTSASAVRGFSYSINDMDKSLFRAVCIGKQTLHEAEKAGFICDVSDEAKVSSMIDKLLELNR